MRRVGLSGGAIAGIAIGVLVGVAAIALAGALLWRRQRHRDTENTAGTSAVQNKPKRNISVLSRSGLLAHARPPSMAEREDEAHYNSTNNGSSSVHHSMIFGGLTAQEGVSPSSVLGSTGDLSDSSRRNSRPLVYDQRLNPSALFANAEANGSRVSMQDQRDYSRPLGVANPDFRASFDSRYSRG
nr:hypothetical protein CFP56_53347 [Quercus suber]